MARSAAALRATSGAMRSVGSVPSAGAETGQPDPDQPEGGAVDFAGEQGARLFENGVRQLGRHGEMAGAGADAEPGRFELERHRVADKIVLFHPVRTRARQDRAGACARVS